MHLARLSLRRFRSWRALDLELPPGLILISGPNASGKTNLIEAIYLLASLRSSRASVDGEMIAWRGGDSGPDVLRAAGRAQTSEGPVEVEVSIAAREGSARDGAPATSKRIRVNGVPKRASEALGAIRAVQFSTLDTELLTGASSGRRRYLDLAIAQTDSAHTAALSRYQRALTQRNALLRRIARGESAPAELDHWDPLLAAEAGRIWSARAEASAWLGERAAARHAEIDADAPALSARYEPATGGGAAEGGAAAEAMEAALASSRGRDLARGHTSVGPHRDELRVSLRIDGAAREAGQFGSRAQQRAAALALRLAEADLLEERTGDPPILLLDDLFSELDGAHRAKTAELLASREQVIVTTPDPAAVPPGLPAPSFSAATTGLAGADSQPRRASNAP